MPYYLLFFGNKDTGGGADDFHSAHINLEVAKQVGVDYWKDGARLSSWMHLAEFDGKDMRISHSRYGVRRWEERRSV